MGRMRLFCNVAPDVLGVTKKMVITGSTRKRSGRMHMITTMDRLRRKSRNSLADGGGGPV
jgi:hypothetical protein